MNILSLRFTAAILAVGLGSVITGCNKQDRTAANTAVQDAYADTKNAMSNAWGDVKSFTFDKRDDFSRSAKSMSSKLDSEMSELRANYSEANASASRKAAMEELKRDEADYRSKVDALGNATAATWDSAKQNVVAAWDKVQASYHKARAN